MKHWSTLAAVSLALLLTISTSETAEYSHACTGGIVQLTCTSPQYIKVTDADYGQNSSCPADQCCEPTPSDCAHPVVSEDPSDWQDMQDDCNNQTSCGVQFFNHLYTVNQCESPYEADYLIIYYDCLPDETTTVATTVPVTTTTTTAAPTTTTTIRIITTTEKDKDDNNDDGPNVGAIVGGVFAVMLLFVFIALLVYLIYRLKRKPLPKKRVAKRPSSVSNAQRPAGLNNANRQSATSPSNGTANTQPNEGSNTATANTPVAPFVAYDNTAYEHEVQIVIADSSKPKDVAYDNTAYEHEVQIVIADSSKPKDDHRLSNGLSGAGDLRGNAPAAASSSTKNQYDNILNETRAQASYHKKRPVSSSATKDGANGGVPQRPNRPPVDRSSKPTAPTKSPHYDTPKSNNSFVDNSKSSESNNKAAAENAYEMVDVQNQAPALEKKTVPPD